MAAGTLENVNIYTTTPAPSNNTNATNATANGTSSRRREGIDRGVDYGESQFGAVTGDGGEFRRNAGDKLQQFWWNKVSKKWECVDSNTYDSVKLTLSG
jgi:hypothetical protein